MRENKSLVGDFGIPYPTYRKQVEEEIEMGKKIKGEETIRLEDGSHTGVITAVEFREPPEHKYEYTDITIKESKTELEIRCGVPTKITEYTALGGVLINFGQVIKKGNDYDVEQILKGKKVQFVTITEKTDRGTFARIQPMSLKPIDKK